MRLFGTDGIRGVVNQYPVTAEAAMGLGKAFVAFIADNKIKNGSKNEKIKVVVGKDTRISGAMLEEALIAGITSSGADVLPLGVAPSNAVSYFIGEHSADGGVMVSASHNPAEENGLKFFSSSGFKLSEEEEEKLEQIFFSKKSVAGVGSVFRLKDVKQSYISYIADSLQGSDLEGLKVAIDCGNGSASHIVKDLFFELKADATIINNEPDGTNINGDCGALFPQQLQEAVKGGRFDAGIALDGDSDRLVMVDESGCIVDGDALIAIAAVDLSRRNRLKKGTVVVTDYSNIGLDSSLGKSGIKVVRVKAGDKNVSSELLRSGLSLGGENSGHIMFFDFAKTADALLAAVQILGIMKTAGRKLSELSSVFAACPQILLNVKVNEKTPIEELPEVASAIRNAKEKLGSEGRVFVRYSGTENAMRILVEGAKGKEIKELAGNIADAVRKELGA